MFIKAPGEGISICRSKDPQEELIERTYGYVTASRRFQRKIRCIEVVEDFESSPHKAVSFVVEITKITRYGASKKRPKRYQASVVSSFQEEGRKRTAKWKMMRSRVMKER